MNDTVFIRALQLPTVIGVYDWEREVRQVLSVDLEMAWDVAVPGASDQVGDALNYAAVSQRLLEFAASSRFQLIEALANEMAALLISEFAVPWLRLRVCKPGAVPQAMDVGVVIERGQRPS